MQLYSNWLELSINKSVDVVHRPFKDILKTCIGSLSIQSTYSLYAKFYTLFTNMQIQIFCL